MEKVLNFLKNNVVCTLATCNNNIPRSSTMEYLMVNDSVMFATDAQSIKAKNLAANNKISLSVHNMPLFVTIDGTTTTPTDEEIAQYNKVLFERHPEMKAMLESGAMGAFVYYKLVPQTTYFNNYATGMSPTEIIK